MNFVEGGPPSLPVSQRLFSDALLEGGPPSLPVSQRLSSSVSETNLCC